MNLESIRAEIEKTLKAHHEWLLIDADGGTFALDKNEIEIEIERGKLLFGFLNDKGFQTWRIAGCEIENEKISLDLTRNFAREKQRIKLVPRISADELSRSVELARLEKANQIAKLIAENVRGAKLIRVALNKESGRFAQIIFSGADKQKIAVLSNVTGAATPENLLTTAIFWLVNLQARRKNPVDVIWILAEKKSAKNLQKLHALLRENWKQKILIKEILRQNVKRESEEIKILKSLKLNELWREKAKPLKFAAAAESSVSAREIVKLAPAEIDIVFSKHGETLRFAGLPFARVRIVANEEKVWFGTERERRILNEKTRNDFFELLENLQIYRRCDTPNKRHAFYKTAPEAWLETILRRNVKLLDANLILSPIHHQFRAANDKIDLLALRRDGRLIVIELKTAPDREMIFQAIDYWRKIELQRRAGNLQKAKIFGDLEISDKPALVYLAAPTLDFHINFSFLAETVAPEIEIYRFDLNENWREDLKVIKVKRFKGEKV